MFNRQNSGSGSAVPMAPPPQPKDIPAPSIYKVEGPVDHLEQAHDVAFDNGCVIFIRIVWANEDCTEMKKVYAIYAPGEWAKVSTADEGFRKSPLSIH